MVDNRENDYLKNSDNGEFENSHVRISFADSNVRITHGMSQCLAVKELHKGEGRERGGGGGHFYRNKIPVIVVKTSMPADAYL